MNVSTAAALGPGLRRLIAAHEAAEEEAVHPVAGAADAGTVEQRLAEEHDLGELISTLEELDVDSTAFDRKLPTLRNAILEHRTTVAMPAPQHHARMPRSVSQSLICAMALTSAADTRSS